jgi:hypothetical protein
MESLDRAGLCASKDSREVFSKGGGKSDRSPAPAIENMIDEAARRIMASSRMTGSDVFVTGRFAVHSAQQSEVSDIDVRATA